MTHTTTFTIFPGTTMIFLIGLPAIDSMIFGSARAMDSIVFTSASAATVILARSLPWTETGIST